MEEIRLTTPPPPAQAVPLGVVANPAGLYVLFVDLRKAFDSTPRNVIWQILTHLGVPAGLVRCVRDMREGIQSKITHGHGCKAGRRGGARSLGPVLPLRCS